MIRRLLYHLFWNFYDYLGSFTLYGIAFTLPLFGLILAGVYTAGHVGSPLFGVFLLGLTLVVALVFVAAGFGGFFAFAACAARGEPARWPVFRSGMASLFKRYLSVLVLVGIAVSLLVANIMFYSKFSHGASPGMAMGFLVAAMLFFWLGVGLWVFLHPVLAAPAWFPDESRIRPLLRKAFILFVLAPVFWFFVGLVFLVFLGLAVLSVVGVLFVLPLFATLTTTGLSIVARHAEYLAEARGELGDGRAISEYKRRAVEKALEWEARQPRRTFRELIKPWEM